MCANDNALSVTACALCRTKSCICPTRNSYMMPSKRFLQLYLKCWGSTLCEGYLDIFHISDAMSTHVTYVVYVKAWYDSNSYIIFQSDGVQVDSTAPELSDSYSVIEVTDAQSNADIDFTASATDIVIKWTNVFIDSHSDMDSFEVMIYSNKLLDVIASDQVAGGVDEVSFTGLSLIQGQHYVSKVVGCNRAGLCTEATSDGFVVSILLFAVIQLYFIIKSLLLNVSEWNCLGISW